MPLAIETTITGTATSGSLTNVFVRGASGGKSSNSFAALCAQLSSASSTTESPSATEEPSAPPALASQKSSKGAANLNEAAAQTATTALNSALSALLPAMVPQVQDSPSSAGTGGSSAQDSSRTLARTSTPEAVNGSGAANFGLDVSRFFSGSPSSAALAALQPGRAAADSQPSIGPSEGATGSVSATVLTGDTAVSQRAVLQPENDPAFLSALGGEAKGAGGVIVATNPGAAAAADLTSSYINGVRFPAPPDLVGPATANRPQDVQGQAKMNPVLISQAESTPATISSSSLPIPTAILMPSSTMQEPATAATVDSRALEGGNLASSTVDPSPAPSATFANSIDSLPAKGTVAEASSNPDIPPAAIPVTPTSPTVVSTATIPPIVTAPVVAAPVVTSSLITSATTTPPISPIKISSDVTNSQPAKAPPPRPPAPATDSPNSAPAKKALDDLQAAAANSLIQLSSQLAQSAGFPQAVAAAYSSANLAPNPTSPSHPSALQSSGPQSSTLSTNYALANPGVSQNQSQPKNNNAPTAAGSNSLNAATSASGTTADASQSSFAVGAASDSMRKMSSSSSDSATMPTLGAQAAMPQVTASSGADAAVQSASVQQAAPALAAPVPKSSAGASPAGSNSAQTLPAAGDLPATASAGPVLGAQMIAKAAQSEMHIGLNTAAFGSVDVHTIVHANDVGILIGSERGDLRSLLANEIPAMAHSLEQQNLRLNQVNVHQGFAFSNNMTSGGNSHPRAYTYKPTAAAGLTLDSGDVESTEPVDAAPAPHSNGYFSILA